MLITDGFDSTVSLPKPIIMLCWVFFVCFLPPISSFFSSGIGANSHHVLSVLNPLFFLACPITGMEPRLSLCQSSV